MKYATLLLGATLVLASIITARAAEMLNCDGVIINPTYAACIQCGEDMLISNLPAKGRKLLPFDLRIKSTPKGLEATLNGKRCHVPE